MTAYIKIEMRKYVKYHSMRKVWIEPLAPVIIRMKSEERNIAHCTLSANDQMKFSSKSS